MDFFLFVLCVSMFLGSFGAGLIPLMVHLNESKLKIVSAYGAGLLVGTALVVIIPEGADTLYRSIGPSIVYKCPDSLTADAKQQQQQGSLKKRDAKQPALPQNGAGASDSTKPTEPTQSQKDSEGHDHSKHSHSNIPQTMGLATVFGFGMMFMLEKLAHSLSSHSRLARYIGGSEMAETGERSSGPTTPKPINTSLGNGNAEQYGNAIAVLVGMIIHCAADGIALGAASSSKQGDLELLVFLAILLHKAPSAFGLTSYLLTAGMQSRRAIKHQLLIFALAAPLTALLSNIILDIIAVSADEMQMMHWTGVLLMVSAGSFLYVATMHVLPEITQNQHSTDCLSPRLSYAASGNEDGIGGGGGHAVSEKYLTLAIVLGLLSPLSLSAFSHGH